MAQLAGCRRSVGLSLGWDPAVHELRGSPGELAELAATLDVPDARAHSPVEMRWGWWCSASSFRAVVVAEPARRRELGDLLGRVAGAHLDVTIEDLAHARAALALAGPGATALVRRAVARLAEPVLATSSGGDYWLLILDRARAVEVRRALLEVGRGGGAVAVQAQATDLYRSAHRILAGQHPQPSRHASIDVSDTGALHP